MPKTNRFTTTFLFTLGLLGFSNPGAADAPADQPRADEPSPSLFADGFEEQIIEISLDDRWAIFEAAGAYFTSLGSLPLAEKNAAMLAWLLEQPLIKDAGIDSGAVWAYLQDGLPILLVDNRRLSSSAPAPSLSSAGGPATLAVAPPDPDAFDIELPASQNVLFLDTFESGYPSLAVTPQLQTRFEEVGYSLRPYSTDASPSMAEFKAQVGDLGLFFITTHGGAGRFEERISSVPVVGPYYAFQSNIELTKAKFAALADTDVAARRLVPMHVTVGLDADGNSLPSVYRWGITDRFVRDYFSFSDDSLVFIDACNSGKARMTDALTAAGAAVVMGWDSSVYANEAAAVQDLLFRRLLGSDQIDDAGYLDNECSDASVAFQPVEDSSPVRPFDLHSIWEEMKRRDRLQGCNETLLTLHREEDSNFGTLVPALRSVQVFPADGTLHLYGLFGKDPGAAGQVFVADTPVAIQSWEQWEIVVELPAGEHGEVYVKKHGIQGNTVALSRFAGSGSAEFVSPVSGLFASADFTLELRGDFSPFRVKPDDEPVYWQSPEFSAYSSDPEFPKFAGRYVELTSGGGNNALLDGGSGISYNYSGSLTNVSCTETGSISGAGALSVLLLNPTPGGPPPGAQGFAGTMALNLLDPPGVPRFIVALTAAGANGTYSNPGCPEIDGAVVDLVNYGLIAVGIKAVPDPSGAVTGAVFVSDEISPFGFPFTTNLTLPTMAPQPAHDPSLYPD